MTVWRLQANTDAGSVADYCLEKHVIAMGWSFREFAAAKKERELIVTFDDFRALADKYYPGKYDSVKRLKNDLQVNDLVWMRYDGKYYIGKVSETSKWSFDTSDEALERDVCNQVSDIVWYEVAKTAGASSVPGAIATAFICGSTLQRIKNPGIQEYSQLLYNSIHDYGEDSFRYDIDRLELNEANFYSLLQPEDAEDLLCLWLYKQKGYVCIPSTNKIATPKYECVLLDPATGKRIYIQVKKGRIDLDAADYADSNGDVYLLTTQGQVLNLGKSDHVYSVSPTEIFEFASDSQNKNLIPERILTWVNFLSAYKGIIFDTNSLTYETMMLKENKVCATGNSQRYIHSFAEGDYVLYCSRGKGVIAIGKVKSKKEMSIKLSNGDEGLYHDVEMIVPSSIPQNCDEMPYISFKEIREVLNQNFFWASIIKTPYLNMKQVQLLIAELKRKYE